MNSMKCILDPQSKVKLYFQLYKNIVDSIKEGTFTAGEKLPSIRDVVKELHVSRNTVNTAYQKLVEEGFISAKPKSGYVINEYNQFSAKQELSGTKKEQKSEESSIPTVTEIVKMRAGSEIQHIPMPEEFEKEVISPAKEQKSSVTKENDSIQPKESLVEQKNSPVVDEIPVKQQVEQKINSVPQIEPPAQKILITANRQPVQEDSFGDKQNRKKIAIELYEKKKISCTSGQVMMVENVEIALATIIKKIVLPVSATQTMPRAKGLLRLAEEAAKGTVMNKENTCITNSYPALFSGRANVLFGKKMNEEHISVKIFSDENKIDISALQQSGATVAVIAPAYAEEVADGDAVLTYDDEKAEEKESRIKELYAGLLGWTQKAPDRYIIEYDKNSFMSKTIPLACVDESKRVFYLAEDTCSDKTGAFVIIPPQLIKQFK